MSIDLEDIREDFPLLRNNVYLDNAATSLSPTSVVESINEYQESYRANIERGIHHLSKIASHRYKDSHKKVAQLLGAKEEEIILTKNTTEGINTIARGLDLDEDGEIVLSKLEHHSNLVPWLKLKKENDVKISYFELIDGKITEEELEEKINDETELVSISHASNVLGTINPIEKIGEICKETNTKFLVDAAQTTAHLPINVEEIGCDYLALSGHKALGPTGTGALFIKKKEQETIEPLVTGGGAVEQATYSDYKLKEGNERYEAGTPNIGGGIAFGEAIDYLQNIGIEKIKKHEEELTNKLIKELQDLDQIEVLYPDIRRVGVVSFRVSDVDSHKIATLLDEEDILVRSGHHCSKPLIKELGYDKVIRVSLACYNNKRDLDQLIESLRNII